MRKSLRLKIFHCWTVSAELRREDWAQDSLSLCPLSSLLLPHWRLHQFAVIPGSETASLERNIFRNILLFAEKYIYFYIRIIQMLWWFLFDMVDNDGKRLVFVFVLFIGKSLQVMQTVNLQSGKYKYRIRNKEYIGFVCRTLAK